MGQVLFAVRPAMMLTIAPNENTQPGPLNNCDEWIELCRRLGTPLPDKDELERQALPSAQGQARPRPAIKTNWHLRSAAECRLLGCHRGPVAEDYAETPARVFYPGSSPGWASSGMQLLLLPLCKKFIFVLTASGWASRGHHSLDGP